MAKEGRFVSFSESGDPEVWVRAGEMLAGRWKARLAHDKRVCAAMAALEERAQTNGSVPPATLKGEVLAWASVAVQKPTRRAHWEKLFASNTGKSWKALREFPERIRRMAEEINTLLCHGYFGQEQAREFWPLPSSLNGYANWVESQIELSRVSGSRTRYRYPQWIVHLSSRVKALTGRFYDKEVAEILNAVDWALNGEGDSNKGFDVQMIIDCRSRHKRKAFRNFYGE